MMITKTNIKKQRGWTERLCKLFLPEPDLKKTNPRKPSTKMLLFDENKIEAIEKKEEFQAEKRKTEKRKTSAEKAIETKRKKIQDYVHNLKVNVPKIDKTSLIKQACNHYNEMNHHEELASANSDSDFIERICVNYLRHHFTKYELHLDEMSGKIGFTDGYNELRKKIFNKISEKYSWLSQECIRQNSKTDIII